MSKHSVAVVAAALAALAIFVGLELLNASRHNLFFLGDFRAFYCGGWALAHGQNPYAAQPLMSCESSPQPLGLYATRAGLAVPAPFPGYALAFFAMFTLLPYAAAAMLWLGLILACATLASVALARSIARPTVAVMLAFVTAYALIVFPLGQLTSIVLCALVAAAMALRIKKTGLAVFALCFAMLSPHVALGAFLALFVWVKESRWFVIAAGAALLALDLAAGGPARAFSYLTVVLPAHAHSEIGGALQYSLTWLVHAAGAASETALRAGEVWYGLMIVCGIVAGGLLARRFHDPAFAVLVPPAFAVIGGPFVHLQEISLALPAAFLLYGHAQNRLAKLFAGAALVLIALPWLWVMDQPWLVAMMAVVTAGLAWGVFGLPPARSLRAALGAVAICACIMIVGAHYGTQIVPKTVNVHAGLQLAQESWAKFVVNGSGITLILGKAPTWLGLLLLAAGCAYAVRSQEDDVTAIAVERAPART